MVLCEDMNTEMLLASLRAGHIVVYPTDTVYGIGCDATNERAVERVYAIKCRGAKPVSVIAPSLAWIRAHCSIPAYAEEWLAKLPGPIVGLWIIRMLNRPDLDWVTWLYDHSVLAPVAATVIRALPAALLVSWKFVDLLNHSSGFRL